MKNPHALTKTVVACTMALAALGVSATAASALDERTDEQLDQLDSWCLAQGGIAIHDVSESNSSFICMLPDGTWIWCGKARTDTTWGCLVIKDEIPQSPTNDDPPGRSTAATTGVLTVDGYATGMVNQPTPPTVGLR